MSLGVFSFLTGLRRSKITTKALRLKEPRRTARDLDRIYRIGKMKSFSWLPLLS
jgi:hypothetical protein